MIRTGFGGTSTKSIVSIVSPEAVQNDGPNGFNSYTLGQYANTCLLYTSDTYFGEALAVVRAGKTGTVDLKVSDGKYACTLQIPVRNKEEVEEC